MSPTNDLPLRLSVHHTECLPADGAVLDVVATVRGKEPAHADVRHDGLAEVILLDSSGSMGAPQAKMRAARQATAAAVGALPDGVAFAVVSGTAHATMVYPGDRRLAVADETTRAAARNALRHVAPHGGTAIGTWLLLARRLLATRPDAIGHVILLTDGRNESQRPADLRAAVDDCVGRFTVDCRAIGSADGVHDWDAAELLGIAEALGANPVVPVEDLTGLTGEFRAVLTRAMSRRVPDVRLRVRTTGLARVRFVKQVHPALADLSGRGSPAGELATDYPVGAWSPHDQRDYHVALEVDAMTPGACRRIGWLSVHAGADSTPVEVPLTVEWTEDALRYSEINESVAYYTRQQDYAAAVQRGLAAARAGRVAEAEEHLGHAVALAHATGRNDDVALLARVVDVLDAAGGRVRLKPDVDARLTQSSLVLAHQTSRWGPQEPPAQRAAAAGPPAPWRHCGEEQTGAYCEGCGAHHLSPERPGAGRP
ncbi:VWA domain-containing protein [Micromonospora peucetia]|uniref:VWA domain-containing protein n=1 Tax=Micromonospora peucetia TaxID=47871 RepID=UPI00331CF28C